jgi:tetratricopeptide (TPR) repeat protein
MRMSYIKKRKPSTKASSPDEIISQTDVALDWARQNSNLIIYLTAAVLFIVILTFGIIWVKGNREKAAEYAFYKALSVYNVQVAPGTEYPEDSGRIKQPGEAELLKALEAFQDVYKNHRNSPQGEASILYSANVLYRLERYLDSIELIEELLHDQSKLAHDIKAQYLLARCFEASKAYDRAIGAYSLMMETSSNDMKGVIMLDMARCFELKGDTDLAVEKYREVLSLYESSSVSIKAEKKLAFLGVFPEELN